MKNKKEKEDYVHFKNDKDGSGEIYNTAYSTKSVQNHPMMIMANERKLDLLQHPVCLALMKHKWAHYGRIPYFVDLLAYLTFLIFLSIYVLTSPGPLTHPELFDCPGDFFNDSLFDSFSQPPDEYFHNSTLNSVGRYGIYFISAIRLLIFFFYTREYMTIWKQFKSGNIKLR